MPRPVPPPPPQPSVEETREAVRLLRRILLVMIALFVAYSQLYRVDGFFVRYGRESTPSWMLWKASRLNEERLRAHPGGRVAWLVGNSVLRESFDEAEINRALAERESVWRVSKFGQDRGASGLSTGLLDRLPIRPGDLVVHAVGMENFFRGWLEKTGVPWWHVAMLLPPSAILQIDEYTPAEKLEMVTSVPQDFWAFHDEAMEGWRRWLLAPLYGVPKPRKTHYTLRFHEYELRARFGKGRAFDEEHPYYIGPDDTLLSDAQFNMWGLHRMARTAAARGVPLALIDIQPRVQYQNELMSATARAQWSAWRAEQPDLTVFPPVPDDCYYDMKHPNFRGRELHSAHLVTWLSARP